MVAAQGMTGQAVAVVDRVVVVAVPPAAVAVAVARVAPVAAVIRVMPGVVAAPDLAVVDRAGIRRGRRMRRTVGAAPVWAETADWQAVVVSAQVPAVTRREIPVPPVVDLRTPKALRRPQEREAPWIAIQKKHRIGIAVCLAV